MTTAAGLVVASNRGPVRWQRVDGELRASRGFGGLVTALGGALQHEPGTWVSVALDEIDTEVAATHGGEAFDVTTDGGDFRLRLVDVGERFDAYYNDVSNRLLWFTLHGLWGAPYEPAGLDWRRGWYEGYVPVGDAVGDAVAAAAAAGGEVLLQDYHLCTTPARVRAAVPDAPILHYLHTPWVEPGELRCLPDPVAEAVLRGLLAADVVALSSPAWTQAFARCATDVLGARWDGEALHLDGWRTVVADYVLGIDAQGLTATAASDAVAEAGAWIDEERGERSLVLRVDRTDLSKNILRGLLAYELLLERYPEHRGRVWHYANLNPSRQGVPEYRAYLDACRDTAERITGRFGADCLRFDVVDDYPAVLAGLQRYDVLLTNPVRDGTNLVAKEGPALNQRDGVLVLSHQAGAADVLAEGALLVNPYDVEATADALHTALTMRSSERAERAERLRAAADIGAPTDWLAAQRDTLRQAVAARR